nr:hypothetical protein [Tanacetum cinerariifolium]
MNIPANDAPTEQAPTIAPLTKTDDQILSLSNWVPIGKSNCILDVQKSQRNPIFLIAVAILKNTNFFRAFTTSFIILAIYIQQFWDTMCFNSSTGLYSCYLDEQWFNLHKDILRDALDITPTNDNNPFMAPPSSDTVIEYVNSLGYPSTLRNVSAISVNALYQPWRAIFSMINMCLTEFVQSIQTFFIDKKNLAMASHGKKKTTHLLIPSIRFTKLIIHHLKTKYNINPRTGSPLHHSYNENIQNTLRFVGKDNREIFAMPIPDALLTDEIKVASYYGKYQEHVAKYQQYLDAEHGKAEEGEATETPKATKVTKPKGPTRLVVIREHKSGRIQPLPNVQGKGKEKVIDEQDAHNLLTLLTPKNKSHVDQFIFQRRTPMPTEASRHAESPSLDAELALTDSEIESDDVVPMINTGDQDEGQDGRNQGIQDKGQTGPNPGVQDKGQAGSNPDDAAESQRQSSNVVHAGPNLEHIDLEAIDALTHQNPEQIDEELTTTAYLNVQKNLKLPSEDQVIHKEPTSSTGTLSSLQNLEKELSLQINTSSVLRMTNSVIDLTSSKSGSPIPTSAATTSAVITTTTIQPPLPQLQKSSADQTLLQRIGELEQYMENLLQYNLSLEERLDKNGSRLYKLENLNIPNQIWKKLTKRKERDVTYQEFLLGHHLYILQQAHLVPQVLQEHQDLLNLLHLLLLHLLVHLDLLSNKVHLFDDEDSENNHLPKADSRKDWWKLMEECHKLLADQVDRTNPEGDQVRVNVNQPLPLSGPPGHVTIQSQFFFNKDLEYLRYDNKGSSPALSISKMKAASYHDFGLELLVPEQMWIDDMCTYDINAKYGISHWLFNQKKFYIDRHDSSSHQKEVRSHMRILSVVRIKAYSRYGYDYLSEIVLRRGDLQEHMIDEKDFKNISTGLQIQGIQDQAAQSGYEYAILDSKGRNKEQRVHNGY